MFWDGCVFDSRQKRASLRPSCSLPRNIQVSEMPVSVSPAIRFSRYAALLIGIGYGYKRNEYLKPYGAKDKKMKEKKLEEQAELKRLRDLANEGKSIFDS